MILARVKCVSMKKVSILDINYLLCFIKSSLDRAKLNRFQSVLLTVSRITQLMDVGKVVVSKP